MGRDGLAHSIVHAALSPSEGMPLLEAWSSDEGGADWSRIAVSFMHMTTVCICH